MALHESPQRFVATPPAAAARQQRVAAQPRIGDADALAQALQSQIPYGARAAIHELLANRKFNQGD
jgi:hypothetical protein